MALVIPNPGEVFSENDRVLITVQAVKPAPGGGTEPAEHDGDVVTSQLSGGIETKLETPNSFWVRAMGLPGPFSGVATIDADLGEGVVPIHIAFSGDRSSAMATSAEGTVGSPQADPDL